MTNRNGPACGNNPNHQLSDGDRRAVEDFKAYLADRGALRRLIAEAINEDLSAHRGRLDQGLLGIVPRLTNAVLAVLAPGPTHSASEAPGCTGLDDNGQPARADLLNTFAAWLFTTGRGSRQAADRILGKHRAEVLHEAADVVRGLLLTRTSITMAELEAVLRRMADETAATETLPRATVQHATGKAARPPVGACANCRGSGLDPRCKGDAACPDCQPADEPAPGARQDGAGS